jgi:hypothetical protein
MIPNGPNRHCTNSFSFQLGPLIPGNLGLLVGSPEKAGVGGSIPVSATTFQRAAGSARCDCDNHARARKAEMRGGGFKRVELNEDVAISQKHSGEVLALNEALNRLEMVNARQAKMVELRYFAERSVEEIGGILSMSPRSVKRDWALAGIWLFKEIQKSPALGNARGRKRVDEKPVFRESPPH